MPRKKLPLPDPETCEHCKFFDGNQSDEFGFCNRFPPVIVVDESKEGGRDYVRPVVSCSETCGEFKRRLNS